METAVVRIRVDVLRHDAGAASDRFLIEQMVDALSRLASFVGREGGDVLEVEINPLFVLPDRVCVVDALVRVSGE